MLLYGQNNHEGGSSKSIFFYYKQQKENHIFISFFILLCILLSTINMPFSLAQKYNNGSFQINGKLNIGMINDITYFTDGSRIAVAADPIPEIINISTKLIEKTLIGQKGIITTIDTSPNYIITGSDDGSVFLWHLNGTYINQINLNIKILKIRFNSLGDKIIIATGNSKLSEYSVPNFNELWTIDVLAFDDSSTSIEWSPSGNYIAAIIGQPGIYVSILNSTTGSQKFSLYDVDSGAWLLNLAWSSDSKFLSVITEDKSDYTSKSIDIWDISNRSIINDLFGYRANSFSLSWFPDSNLIASCDYYGETGYIRIWWSNLSEFQKIIINNEQPILITTNPKSYEFITYSKNNENLNFWHWVSDNTVERPYVRITQPTTNSEFSDNVLIKGISWGKNEIIEVRVKIGDGNWYRAKGTTTWEIIIDISNFNPGQYLITALSYDGGNFSLPDTLIITVVEKTSDYDLCIRFSTPEAYSDVKGIVPITGIYYSEKKDWLNTPPQRIQMAIDDHEWFDIIPEVAWSYIWNSSNFTNGQNILYAKAFDGSKWSTPVSLVLYVHNPGQPPPPPILIFIEYPIENQKVNGTINVKGRIEYPTINSTVSLSIDGDNWIEIPNNHNWSYYLNTTKYLNGALTILAKGFNGINLTQYAKRTIIVNNSIKINLPPTIKITIPLNNSQLLTLTEIRGIADDDYKVNNIYIKIDNDPWKNASGTTSWKCNISNTNLTKGKHNIFAKSYDGELYSSMDIVEFTINNTKPPNGHDHNNIYSTYVVNGILIIIIIIIIVMAIILTVQYNIRKEKRKSKNLTRKERTKQKYRKR